MKKLIDRLRKLSEAEQDRYAATYLKALEDDQRWEELFTRTTDEQWKRLIENARKRETRKITRPLTDMIGDAPGLYESPADADKTISNQRDEWEY